ncbi:hypothetical protein ROR02_02530 [Pararhodospirillum oryzae]|uniref:Methanolan biosynthesis EpsI domain-containing protein n=2 Tax=Pararhodospirillum oryzae TaxID=478448 RepID=A0A512H3S9_9PROT|nr:hypothetical protein ROR02_02530 [Pararhodospirillum oryzae]
MISFGYIVAYFFKGYLWKRIILLLSTIPIAILMNSLRITLIGVTVDRWGVGAAEGLIHDFEGWVVFLLCVAVLLAEAVILATPSRGDRICLDYLTVPRPPFWTGPLRLSRPTLTLIVLSAAIAVLASAGIGTPRHIPVGDRHPVANFPLRFGDWHGSPLTLDADVLGALKLQDYFLGDYQPNQRNPPVNLYVAYYGQQRVGAMTHSPASCIPSAGWKVLADDERILPVENSLSLPIRRVLVGKGETRQLVYYWFQQRCRSLTNQIELKWWLFHDSLLQDRTDGSLIRLVTAVLPDETEEEADARLGSFLDLAYPLLRHRLNHCGTGLQ